MKNDVSWWMLTEIKESFYTGKKSIPVSFWYMRLQNAAVYLPARF